MFPRWLLPALLSLALCQQTLSQEEAPRTIRVKRESDLARAQFDNTQLRLFVTDRFGNARDNEISSYWLYVKTARRTRSFHATSAELTPEMISFLEKQEDAVKIFFTGITAVEEGHPVRLPDVIETWFPECRAVRKPGKKKRPDTGQPGGEADRVR